MVAVGQGEDYRDCLASNEHGHAGFWAYPNLSINSFARLLNPIIRHTIWFFNFPLCRLTFNTLAAIAPLCRKDSAEAALRGGWSFAPPLPHSPSPKSTGGAKQPPVVLHSDEAGMPGYSPKP